MNRRTFLKSIGAAMAVISTPAMAKAKAESKWINFTEQMPKVGQRVAMFTRFNDNTGQNISLGEVIQKNKYGIFWRLDDDVIVVEIGLSYSPARAPEYGDNDLIVHNSMKPVGMYCGSGFYDSDNEITAKVEKAIWIKNKTIFYDLRRCFAPRHGRKISKYIGRDVAYWFPITEDIPENLPEFPDPKSLNIQYRCGTNDSRAMLIKE